LKHKQKSIIGSVFEDTTTTPQKMNNGINYTEIYNDDYYVSRNGERPEGSRVRPNDEHYGIRNLRQDVGSYHQTSMMGVIDYRKGAKNTDIAQLKSVDRRNLKMLETGDAECKFGIGFEVEKTRLSRGAKRDLPLFAGYERDSSCGYEGVSNILPLLPAGKWRNKVFSMMHDARKIIEDSYSPSDHRCGGHVTLSCEGMTGEELFNATRENLAIVFALFRKRLSNRYCNANPRMESNFQGTRYVAVQQKANVIEVRLVSRFQSVKQMMRRYELFYTIMDFSINNPNGSHASLLKKVRPIVKSMYNGDEAKTDEILEIAKHFNKYIKTGRINRGVINFVDPMRRLDAESHYDRDLLRNGYRA